jgi:antitoxin YefM
LIEYFLSDFLPLVHSLSHIQSQVAQSADDWEREQETLHILQSSHLMQQIAESIGTHGSSKGYKPTQEQIDELTSL